MPDAVLVIAKRNYKVYADLGVTTRIMSRAVSVLDTGAGPNFIAQELLPRGSKIQDTALESPILDANKNPLTTRGTVVLLVRLGRRLVRLRFIVCAKLAAPVILGYDFCNRFVEYI